MVTETVTLLILKSSHPKFLINKGYGSQQKNIVARKELNESNTKRIIILEQ